MKTPPFLMAAALLFWGWRTGWMGTSIVLGAIFELSRVVKFRWEFTTKEYTRVFDVCTLLFVGAVIYLRFSQELDRSGFMLFQWMPGIFALMLLTQAYGARERIPYEVFSWFMRLRREESGAAAGLNISWPYFGICLMAAGATVDNDRFFFAAVVALCAWAAWATRVKRFTAPVWAALFVLAAGLGWVGQASWSGVQTALAPIFGRAFARWAPKDFDALHARTMMGEVGAKKGSGAIVLRVKADPGPVPHLLRQATFDQLRGTVWNASHRDTRAIPPENDVTTWTLIPDQRTNDAVRISGYLHGKSGLLSLPQGVTRLRELPVAELQMTALGVARVKNGPGVVSYRAEFAPKQSTDDPPGDTDRTVPPAEQEVITEVAAKMRPISGTNAISLIHGVEHYFAAGFTYSLYHKENAAKEGSAIGRFLTKTHTGHCEYFASATVLLLRELGIPARYVVGYSVQEMKGETYIVRDRHAHAWALAWFDGAWHEVDTTPGTWAGMEQERASKFEAISDFFSDVWFKFSMWRWLGQKGVISRYAPFLILPLAAILVWRIFFRKNRVKTSTNSREKFNWPGLDSEYYELEARLAASGHERHPHETPAQWLARLRKDGVDHPSLPALVDLHYRYRFDPRGLETIDRKQLRQLAAVEVQVDEDR